MQQVGPEQFILVPVQVTQPKVRLHDELIWINSFPWVFNVQKKWRPWQVCPREIALKKYVGDNTDLEKQAQRWIDNLRINEAVPTYWIS